MADEKKTTKTWSDSLSGLRRHELMTEEIGKTIPSIGATQNVENGDSVIAKVKLFSPYSSWTWYVTEWEAETGLCFGLVEGFDTEWGYFGLEELAQTTVFGGVPAIERDLYWEPKTIGEITRETSSLPA